MLIKSKPSTAHCNRDIYMTYLLGNPLNTSCSHCSYVMGTLSHDSVNRFLAREKFEPNDLFNEGKEKIVLIGGILSVDDTVIDKPYSDARKATLVDYFWSGKHKAVVKGINLITLFYTDINGISVPINYRLNDKSDGRTKNDYFKDMLHEVLEWGVAPAWVTGDSWYSSLENLKFIRKKMGLNFMFAIEQNRLISVERGQYIQIQNFEGWSEDHGMVYLKDYGMVKIFRQIYKNVYRYYIMSTVNRDDLNGIQLSDFKRVHSAHWGIEQFHRAVKQVCNIEKFYVRKEKSVRNHIYCALRGFVTLEFMRDNQQISHWYEVKKNLITTVLRDFILNNSQSQLLVNA